MPGDKDVVRSRTDLVELVAERVRLTRAGRKFRGLCPFHTEKTPSFYVDSDLQLYYCFGCSRGGDAFAWVMATENVDFRTALEMLAKRVGVQLSRRGGAPAENRERWQGIMEDACRFFRDALGASREAQEYVVARGLTHEAMESWEIGYAPEVEHGLAVYLKQRGHRLQDAGELGLVSGSQQEGFGDFFRDRIMFPIRDEQGSLVAFGGRARGPAAPKYLNSRDTPLFRKSETLYGLHRAGKALRGSRHAILVEGYLDVIACDRAGVSCPIAALGTAFTRSHARKLKRWCDRLTIVYDGDSAGREAARRTMTLLPAEEIACTAALLPPGDDPDSVLKREGGEALRQAVAGACGPLRFTVQGLMRDHGARQGITDQRFWAALKAALAESEERLEADALVDEIATLHPNARADRAATVASLRREVEALRRPRRAVGRRTASPPGEVAQEAIAEPAPRPAERVILRAALSPEFRALVWPKLGQEDLIVSEAGRALADAFLGVSLAPPCEEPRDFVFRLDPAMQALVMALEPPPDPYRRTQEPLTQTGVEKALSRLDVERRRRLLRLEWEKRPDIETAQNLMRARGKADV